MRPLRTAPGLVLLALIVALSVVGASSGDASKEFTADDFKKVAKDTPEAKVGETLGKPKEAIDLKADGKVLFYTSKGSYYCVTLKDGKVISAITMKDKNEYDLTLGLVKGVKELKDKMDKDKENK